MTALGPWGSQAGATAVEKALLLAVVVAAILVLVKELSS